MDCSQRPILLKSAGEFYLVHVLALMSLFYLKIQLRYSCVFIPFHSQKDVLYMNISNTGFPELLFEI